MPRPEVMHQVLGCGREVFGIMLPQDPGGCGVPHRKRRRRTRVFPDASPLPLLGIIFD